MHFRKELTNVNTTSPIAFVRQTTLGSGQVLMKMRLEINMMSQSGNDSLGMKVA